MGSPSSCLLSADILYNEQFLRVKASHSSVYDQYVSSISFAIQKIVKDRDFSCFVNNHHGSAVYLRFDPGVIYVASFEAECVGTGNSSSSMPYAVTENHHLADSINVIIQATYQTFKFIQNNGVLRGNSSSSPAPQIAGLNEETWLKQRECSDNGVDSRKNQVELEGAIEGLRQQQEGLQDQTIRLQQEIKELQEIRCKLGQMLEPLKQQTEQEEQRERADLASQLAANQLQAKREELDKVSQELNQSIRAQEELEKVRTEKEERCAELESQLAEDKSSKECLEGQLKTVKEELKRTQEMRKEQEGRCAELESQLAENQSFRKGLEEKLASLQQEEQARKEELKELQKSMEDQQQQLDALQKQNAELQVEFEKEKEKSIKLKEILSRISDALADNDNSLFREINDAVGLDHTDQPVSYDDLVPLITKNVETIKQLELEKQELEERLGKLQTSQHEKLESINMQYRQLRIELEKMATEYNSLLQSAEKRMSDKLGRKEQTIEKMSKNIDLLKSHMQEALEHVNRELSEKQEEVYTLQEAYASKQHEIKKLQDEVKELQQGLQEEKNTSIAHMDQNIALKEEKRQLCEDNVRLNEELESLKELLADHDEEWEFTSPLCLSGGSDEEISSDGDENSLHNQGIFIFADTFEAFMEQLNKQNFFNDSLLNIFQMSTENQQAFAASFSGDDRNILAKFLTEVNRFLGAKGWGYGTPHLEEVEEAQDEEARDRLEIVKFLQRCPEEVALFLSKIDPCLFYDGEKEEGLKEAILQALRQVRVWIKSMEEDSLCDKLNATDTRQYWSLCSSTNAEDLLDDS